MFDDLFNRIRTESPKLITLTADELALLDSWLEDHPSPPSYYDTDIQRGILCAYEEQDVDQVNFWTVLRATLKYNQAETSRVRTSITEPDVVRLIEAIGDDTTLKIDTLTRRKDLSGENKMRAIVRLDPRFAGKKSGDWAILLGVSPDAVRGYAFWKELRRLDKTTD